MHPYAGNPAVYPTAISLIDDSDAPTASNFDAAPQALADRTAFLNANVLYKTGGVVSGTIEIGPGGQIVIDPPARVFVRGLLEVASGATLLFDTGSNIAGTVSGGLLHVAGAELSLENLGSVVANHNQSIQAAQPGSIAPTVPQGIASGIAGGIVATVAGGIAPTVPGGISDGGIAGGIEVTVPDGLKVLGGATLDVENLGLLAILSGGELALETGSSMAVTTGAVVEVLAGGQVQVDAGGSVALAGTMAVASGGEIDIQAGSHGVQVAANTTSTTYASPPATGSTVTLPLTPAGSTAADIVSTVKGSLGILAIPTADDAVTHIEVLVGFNDKTSGARGLIRFMCSAVNAAGTITNVSSGNIAAADQAAVLNLLFGGSPPVQTGIGGFGGISAAYNVVATASGGTLQINLGGVGGHNILWTAKTTAMVI